LLTVVIITTQRATTNPSIMNEGAPSMRATMVTRLTAVTVTVGGQRFGSCCSGVTAAPFKLLSALRSIFVKQDDTETEML
jgi:hypothetical protein